MISPMFEKRQLHTTVMCVCISLCKREPKQEQSSLQDGTKNRFLQHQPGQLTEGHNDIN